ncbi:MAG: LPS biosynthesis protein [Thiotrichales bacterium]|nr:MAG: LPS biosynthesis protein [Thiotrichales bacterium]
MSSISIIVITKNEAHNIEACLQSVSWATEIIVLDSGSRDNTVALAKKFTNNVTVTADWPGDGAQKQRGLHMATGTWILILDADERVTPELKTEILQTITNTSHSGFNIPYQSYYCNQAIHFGDWSHEKHLRLFRRNQANIAANLVHFKVQLTGTTGTMRHKILHYSFRTLEDVLHKVNYYSTDGALLKQQRKQSANFFSALGHGAWTFFRGYIFRLGFLDGRFGLMLAISNAEGCYYRYLKLWLLSRK